MSFALGASVNVRVLPPSNLNPSPGTWRTSLTKIRRVSWILIGEPLLALIETTFPPWLNGKVSLFPSNKYATSSKSCNWPTDQPVNSSVNISSIVNWNSW